LGETEIELLDAAPRDEWESIRAISDLFNQRTLTGWSSNGHTGVDVPLYVFGPGGQHFHGVMQNEDIGKVLWQVFLTVISDIPKELRRVSFILSIFYCQGQEKIIEVNLGER